MSEPVDQDELQMKDESNVEYVKAWMLTVKNNVKLVKPEK